MTIHKQVRVQHRGHRMSVDEGMAPLLRALWHHKIPTVFSCQGDDGHPAYVAFPSWAADDFLRLVLATAPDRGTDPLARRIDRSDHREYGGRNCACCWHWESWVPSGSHVVLVRSLFPASDIAVLVDRLAPARGPRPPDPGEQLELTEGEPGGN